MNIPGIEDADIWHNLGKAYQTPAEINDPHTLVDPKFRITDIPRVMRDVKNWPKSAELMELWFSLPARKMTGDEKSGERPAEEYPETYKNTTLFSWDWLEHFDRVKSAQNKLLSSIYTNNAHKIINRKIVTYLSENNIQKFPTTIEFPAEPAFLHSTSQFQLYKIGYEFEKVDDLYGALGNFAIYAAITKCSLFPLSAKPYYRVRVHELGLYMRDTYDFLGDQYLGHWCDEGLTLDPCGIIRNLAEKYDDWREKNHFNEYNDNVPKDTTGEPIEAFGNSDYNRYRAETSLGGDLLLFSNVKKISVNMDVRHIPKLCEQHQNAQ